MMQNYKIYHNDKVVYLLGSDCDQKMVIIGNEITVNSEIEIKQSLAAFIAMTGPKTTILRSNCSTETLFKLFKKQFKIIDAAGGLVLNENKQYLFIFRRGKWDLPKGKLDPGESFKNAGIREVMEETGLPQVEITSNLGKTWHIFQLKNRMALKQTNWYLMYTTKGDILKPQIEEDILEVKWFEEADLENMITLTHASIGNLLETYISHKKD
jgi:8-oxo-dGTP pyrophosphatase MutT (NUDIX family)